MIRLRPLFLGWLLVVITAVTACTQPLVPHTVTPTTAATAVSVGAVSVSATATAPSGYPAPAETAVPATAYPMPATAYPAPADPTSTPTAAPKTPTPGPTIPGARQQYLPLISLAQPTSTPIPSPTATPLPTATPTPTPTPIPVLDFPALRAQLQGNGQDLAYAKIGFHTAVGGSARGLDEWMQRLDAAGVPFFLKSADSAQPLFAAQEIMRQSGVPHTLVYRRVGNSYDVPDYNLPPDEAARQHWALHMAAWPPELDPSLVWIETINEVDKNRSEWLAQFALTTAQLALADGFKWAAFGWSSGEPEPADWQSPAMLQFLRLAAQHPDRLAIALHEYSYLKDDIAHEYPFKVGRFQELFRICDQYGIARPTVLITEWGWTYESVPTPERALQDIAWAANMYAQFPQVKGAAIWYLGGGFAGIAQEAQQLIYPVMVYSLTHYFAVSPPTAPVPINPEQFRP